jgi:uncharacterized protein
MRLILMLCTLLAAALPVGAAAQEIGRMEEPSPSPLYEASRAGDVVAIQRLLKAGADPNAGVILDEATGNRDTPLGIALNMRPDELLEVVRLLLEAGADPNLVFGRVGDEVAPLHVAVMASPEVVRLLLEAGADPNVASCGGYFSAVSTPLETAEFAGESEIAELLRGAGAADPSKSGAELAVARYAADAPLHAAVWQGDFAAVDRLLAAGSDPNAAIMGRHLLNGDVERYTPLGLALRFEPVAPLDAEEAVAPLDAEFETGPPFDADIGHDIVHLLLEAGADPSERFDLICTGERHTALSIAVMAGDASLMRLLLQAGADPNAAAFLNGALVPPLIVAASGLPGVVRLLLDAGADPNAAVEFDGTRFTPLEAALSEGQTEVAALLRAAGAEKTPSAPPASALPRAFGEDFATCTPGAFFTSSVAELGASVRYQILGPERNGCRVSLTFDSNPNPEWEDRPLLLTLDPKHGFMVQFEEGMQSCLSGGETRFDCAGPLMEVLQR